jgi:uncharacterized membrane protein YcjF (UPF0283 family)
LPGARPLLQYKGEHATRNRGGLMKNVFSVFTLLTLFTLTLAGCELIGDIFQAGVWVGVIIVVAIIALIVWLVSRMRAS